LGYAAFSSGVAFDNSTALGFDANITASNQVRLGNNTVTSIGGQVGWTTLSDSRFKTGIKETIPGLSFIMKLHPVSYYINMNAIAAFLKTPDSLRLNDAERIKSNVLQTGFLAQEVEQAAKEINYDFSGVDKPKNDDDYYGLRYAEFVVPLVKAIQEQQLIIQDQQKQIDELNILVKKLINTNPLK